MISKPALIPWAARMAAEYAVSAWDSLSEVEPLERVRDIKDAHERVAGVASAKGDTVHEVIDSWCSGKPYGEHPKEVSGFVSSFINFMTEVRPVFLENETTLWSRTHGYAGTCDWIAEIDGVTVLGDNKTGKRVYPEAAMQLAALAGCDCIIREDGTEEPIPKFGRLMILHIRPRSWRLHEVTARETAFSTFLAARKIWEWNQMADRSLRQVA